MKRVLILPFVLLSVILALFVPAKIISAADTAVTWRKVSLPAEGKAGGWALAKGADIRCLAQSADGTLYCYANPAGTTFTLFKSVDNGLSWSFTGGVAEAITDIVSPPDNANVLYYATASAIYKSNDAGETFMPLPPPGGAGTNNITITSFDVVRTGSFYTIAAATRDADAGEFGGVYLYDEAKANAGWQNTNIGSRDVYKIAFALKLIMEQPHLIAVTNTESSTVISAKTHLLEPWGNLLTDTAIPVATLVGADIAFPDNYAASPDAFTVYLALNSGTNAGDAYIVYFGIASAPSTFVDLNIGQFNGINNTDVSSIAISGSSQTGRLLAGLAGSAQVYVGSEGGANWTRCLKPPSGSYNTEILFASDFALSGRAYACTGGTESGFSVTADAGSIWNQISLINTQLNNIVDVIPSPAFDSDNTLFLQTFGVEYSLWRSTDAGVRWERIFNTALPDADGLDMVRISPQFGSSGVIYLIGTSKGNPVIWKSTDRGQSFSSPVSCFDTKTLSYFTPNQCVVTDDSSLILGCYDGTRSAVYRTTNSGGSFATKSIMGSGVLHSLAISPDYANDRTVLAGNRAGWIYYSDDNGESFVTLPGDAAAAPLSGYVSAAFDPDFSTNHTVYAASDTAGKGIWRFVIGESTGWENIDSTLPAGGIISSLGLSADGLLYASNNKAGGGVERCLNPALAKPDFETVTRGLDTTVRLSNLKISGDNLWVIDKANNRLLTFSDTAGGRVTLIEPADETGSTPVKGTVLSWSEISGVTGYEWQADTDDGFGNIAAGFSGTTSSTSVRLPALETGTTFFWRVRAVTPVTGRWSAVWKFTTLLGGEVDIPQLKTPEVGAIVPVKPVLQWNAVAGAEGYEIIIATDYAFAETVVEKTGENALPTTAWQCDVSLLPDTTYYWKIRAVSGNNFSPWSNTGVFITELPPVVKQPAIETTPTVTITVSPEVTTTPVSQTQPPSSITLTTSETPLPEATTPAWANRLIYLGIAILAVMAILLITVIAMLVRMNRD